jgi:hypothetical protein
VESDEPPRRSRRVLQLPPDFMSLPSKRRRVIIRGTRTSTIQACDSTRMSTEPGLQNSGSPSTPIPTIVINTPSTPATSMVVVPEVPIITMAQPIVNAQATASNPFGSLATHRATMFTLSLWLLVHFLMVCLTSLRSFQAPSQLLALMLALGLGVVHPPTLPFHLVDLKSLK